MTADGRKGGGGQAGRYCHQKKNKGRNSDTNLILLSIQSRVLGESSPVDRGCKEKRETKKRKAV